MEVADADDSDLLAEHQRYPDDLEAPSPGIDPTTSTGTSGSSDDSTLISSR